MKTPNPKCRLAVWQAGFVSRLGTSYGSFSTGVKYQDLELGN
jgi:hypothetical protein